MLIKFDWCEELIWEEDGFLSKTDRTMFLYSISEKKIEILYKNPHSELKENLLSITFTNDVIINDSNIWIIQTFIDMSYIKEFSIILKDYFNEWIVHEEKWFLEKVVKDLLNRLDNYFSSNDVEGFLKCFDWMQLNNIHFYEFSSESWWNCKL